MAELIEREELVAATEQAVEAVAAGDGRALLLEGAPGLGKTEFLAAAGEIAHRNSFAVSRAQGGELEQSLAWGVARELLAARARAQLDSVPPACRSALGLETSGSGEDPITVAFALTQFCAELAARRPLALLVDDAQWSDAPSLKWLAYLAPRLRELRVLLIIAARSADPRRPDELTVLAGRDGVATHELHPLSLSGVARLVRATLGDADDGFCSRCHDATGGNAFLLVELLRELQSDRQERRDPDFASMTLERVDRVIKRRLVAAGAEAQRLALVSSVFGANTLLADVAAVAGVPPAAAQLTADALRAAGVLSDNAEGHLTFVHPLIRASIRRLIAPGERSTLHLRAARHLSGQGERIEQVGLHLLATEPGADRWVQDQLTAAGDAALKAGAPKNAIALYQRALAERTGRPPAELLAKLGRAAALVDPPAARQPLMRALDATAESADKVSLAMELAVVLQTLRRSGEAVEILDRLIDELRQTGAPRSLQLRVEAELLAQSFFDQRTTHLRRRRLPMLAGTLTGADEEEALIVVQQVVEAINTGTASEVHELTDRAWANGRLVELAGSPTTPAVMWIPYAKLYVDEYDWTMRVAAEWVSRARDSGSAVLAAFANAMLAEAQWRAGAMYDAQASGESAWEIARELGPSFPGWWMGIGVLAQALLARGRATEALDLMQQEGLLDGAPPEVMLMPMPRAVRGEVLIATGHLEQGVGELLQADEWLQRQREPSPGGWRFYTTLIDGLIALDRRAEASEAAHAWLRRTRRFGALSSRGMAERAVALTATDARSIDGLRRAALTLGKSGAQAEHARTLAELGAALRRRGIHTEARPPLRQALDLATRCGADTIAEKARVELLATGARPRRAAHTGADALTPSERRVAQLAASGLTNRQIAASLFISRKTVERHLANIYLKLGTNDRTRIGTQLEPTTPKSR